MKKIIKSIIVKFVRLKILIIHLKIVLLIYKNVRPNFVIKIINYIFVKYVMIKTLIINLKIVLLKENQPQNTIQEKISKKEE